MGRREGRKACGLCAKGAIGLVGYRLVRSDISITT